MSENFHRDNLKPRLILLQLCVYILRRQTVCARHEGVWGTGSYRFLTLALDGDKLSASRPGCFTSQEKKTLVPVE